MKNGFERGMTACEPQFSVLPIRDYGSVSVAFWFHLGSAQASLSPNAARMLAVHLSRAADEAEAAEQADLVDAARSTVACVESEQ